VTVDRPDRQDRLEQAAAELDRLRDALSELAFECALGTITLDEVARKLATLAGDRP
jgi:hypothetical protein